MALVLAGTASDLGVAAELLRGHLSSGAALSKFHEMVSAQGGSLDAPRPVAPAREIAAERAGYVAQIDGEQLGLAVIEMGGGRRLMTDPIDHSVGLEMLVRLGDHVDRGQPVVRLFAPRSGAERVAPMIAAAIQVGDERPASYPLVVELVGPTNTLGC
jgi:thymidine phosphorylase